MNVCVRQEHMRAERDAKRSGAKGGDTPQCRTENRGLQCTCETDSGCPNQLQDEDELRRLWHPSVIALHAVPQVGQHMAAECLRPIGSVGRNTKSLCAGEPTSVTGRNKAGGGTNLGAKASWYGPSLRQWGCPRRHGRCHDERISVTNKSWIQRRGPFAVAVLAAAAPHTLPSPPITRAFHRAAGFNA